MHSVCFQEYLNYNIPFTSNCPSVPCNSNTPMKKILWYYQEYVRLVNQILLKPKSQSSWFSRWKIKTEKDEHHLVEGPATVNFKSSFWYDMEFLLVGWILLVSFFLCLCTCTIFFGELFILYWSIADWQCYDSFRHTAKWPSHTYTCIHSPPSYLLIQPAI